MKYVLQVIAITRGTIEDEGIKKEIENLIESQCSLWVDEIKILKKEENE